MSQATESAASPPALAEERKFRIAPVCFALPEACVPDPFFVFSAAQEKLMLTICVEERDGDAAAVLSRRLKDLKLCGVDFAVEQRKLVKIGGHAGALLVVSVGTGQEKTTIGLCLVAMKSRRFWDLHYEFQFPGEGSTDEFENLLADVRFPDSVPPAPTTPLTEDLQSVDLFGLRAILPLRLRRTTAYRFKDPAASVSWEVDAAWRSAPLATMDPEPDSPMIKELRRQEISLDSISGTSIQYRCTDPGTGRPSDFVLRADVILARQARVILRGTGPESAAARLDADLDFLLRNAALEKED
jgi:hypothetical protein